MKSAVETLNPTRVKLTVEVPFEELAPSLDAAYKTIGSQIQIPGFRKGKVPPRIIDQRVGRGPVIEEAVNDALPTFYGKAVEEADIRPLGQPQVEVTGVPDPKAGGDLVFTVEVDIRPEITLPDFATLSASVEDLEITDADIDERLTQLRERFGTLVGVDRAAADQDFVSIDLTAEINGEEIETVKGHSYQVGAGVMIDGLDEALIGMTAGEEKVFVSALAGGERQGEEADITVTVQSVKERELPEADDDFAQLASEFDTLDELRTDLRSQVEQTKRQEQGVAARDALLKSLLEAVDIPVPESLVTAEVDRHLESENRQADDEHRAEVEVEAREAFKVQMLLDAIAEQENIQVSQPELIEYIVQNASRAGMDPNSFAQAVDQAGQVPAMVGEVTRRKALAVALEKATITDASGNVVDLNLTQPDTIDPDAIAEQDLGEDEDEVIEPETVASSDDAQADAEPNKA